MAAVSSSPRPVQGCLVRELGRMRYRALATPQFAARWLSQGTLKQALGAAPVVVFNRKDDLQDRFLRELGVETGAGTVSGPRHYIPASEAYLEAVRSGLGWGMLPDLQAVGLGSGELVEIAPDRPIDVPLYWQQWKLGSPELTAVGDAVIEAASRLLTR